MLVEFSEAKQRKFPHKYPTIQKRSDQDQKAPPVRDNLVSPRRAAKPLKPLRSMLIFKLFQSCIHLRLQINILVSNQFWKMLEDTWFGIANSTGWHWTHIYERLHELRMLSSVTLNCQVKKIVMNSGCQNCNQCSVSIVTSPRIVFVAVVVYL